MVEKFIKISKYLFDKMSLARYELKSVPGTFIDIPRPYARKAEAFVKRVLETPLVLQENSSDLAYLTNPGLLVSS